MTAPAGPHLYGLDRAHLQRYATACRASAAVLVCEGQPEVAQELCRRADAAEHGDLLGCGCELADGRLEIVGAES
jgi:hypothetical protein